MAIDWGPSREVLWWFETDYVVKLVLLVTLAGQGSLAEGKEYGG